MSEKLRIAILVDQNRVRYFENRILEKIESLITCEIVLVINHVNPDISNKGLVYRVYNYLDSYIFGRGRSFVKLQQPDLKHVEYLEFQSTKVSGLAFAEPNLKDEIERYNIDLILKFSDTVFDGNILSTAKYGIWEYAYGKERTSASLAGLRETMDGDPVINIILQKLADEKNDGYIVDTFLASADPLSAYNNRNIVCWKTHMMMVRSIEEFAKNPEKMVADKSEDLIFFKKKQDVYPTNIQMLGSILRLIYRNIATQVDRVLYKAQWSIYYAENEENYPFQRDMSRFIKINTPNHLFWADPFVIDKEDKSYIFFEDYVYKTRKGHISVLEYDHRTKEISKPSVVIDTAYHQSYPFILAYDDEIYMIPEGSKDLDVKLYKAVDFPLKWEVVRTFFKGKEVVDTTLLQYDGKWWLFANMINEKGQSLNEELYIYYCNDFRFDEWIPHAMNPVISSVQTSRPGGKIISYKGTLYRPSQNSVGSYGRSTNFNRIVELTPDQYREKFVSEITSDFLNGNSAQAIHTYNSSKKLTVVDVVHKIKRFSYL